MKQRLSQPYTIVKSTLDSIPDIPWKTIQLPDYDLSELVSRAKSALPARKNKITTADAVIASSAAMTVFSAFAVGGAILYAKKQEKTRQEHEERPRMVAYAGLGDSVDPRSNVRDGILIIDNIGETSAKNVRVKITPDHLSTDPESKGIVDNLYNRYDAPIITWSPGLSIITQIWKNIGGKTRGISPQFWVSISYQHKGVSCYDQFRIDSRIIQSEKFPGEHVFS